jgi:transcriptional regulator of acetoin/glycerol metabolism
MVAVRRDDVREMRPGLGVIPRARRDSLPEHTPYQDTGCEVHHSCLTCPLLRCRYDEPGGARKQVADMRDRSIVLAQRQGGNVDSIARRFGVSRRTVFRALAKARTTRTTGGSR